MSDEAKVRRVGNANYMICPKCAKRFYKGTTIFRPKGIEYRCPECGTESPDRDDAIEKGPL